MPWWQQVRRGAMRQQRANDFSCYNKSTIINDSCSCLQQRHCSRLTCYRNITGNSSSHRETLPLFTLAILMLAMPLIEAAAYKRSLVETKTSIDIPTTNVPTHTEGGIDFTTVTTPQLVDAQTIKSVSTNKQNVDAADVEVPIVNELETTAVNDSTNKLSNQAISLDLPQDVNNEISQGVSEDSGAEIKGTIMLINPKFDYTETLLTENLEETIRNTVKNEIEFEHDIGSAVAEHLQAVTDLEERKKLSDEISAIQSAQQRFAIESNKPVDKLTELASRTSIGERSETLVTENSSVRSTESDLSIYFPVQNEELQATEKFPLNKPRDARNLIDDEHENSIILSHSTETENQITADNEMENIEEKENENRDELLTTSKSHLFEAALHSYETNGIVEHVKNEPEIDNSNENHDVEAEIKLKSTENIGSLSAGLSANLNTTQGDHINLGNEDDDVENEDKIVSSKDIPIGHKTSEVTPIEGDEASLSIVLNENLGVTEIAEPLENDQTEDIVHLEESKSLLVKDPDTTVEPDTVKSVHIVIKKPGVELDDDKIEPEPIKIMDETTAWVDTKQETPESNESYERDEIVETTTVEDENDESALGIQNDDTVKVTTLQLKLNINEKEVSFGVDNNEGDAIEDSNITDTIPIEQSPHDLEVISDGNDSATNELDADFEEKLDASENEYLIQTNNEHEHHDEKQTLTHEAKSSSSTASTVKPVFIQVVEDNSVISQDISKSEPVEQIPSKSSTTLIPKIESGPTFAGTADSQTTTPKEFEAYEDESNNTDDPDIVPILVGVSAEQSDVTASTKGSRSINTQTHNSMLLKQHMDGVLAATLFETYPPHNAGQTLNDHLAAESDGGIGKPLPAHSISEATSASLFSRSGSIILICSAIAFMFLLASVVAFLVSFQRQRGTLDIEMQEQRCGKDNLDEEEDNNEEEAGTCTKLLEIELPKSSVASVSCEEMEECL